MLVARTASLSRVARRTGPRSDDGEWPSPVCPMRVHALDARARVPTRRCSARALLSRSASQSRSVRGGRRPQSLAGESAAASLAVPFALVAAAPAQAVVAARTGLHGMWLKSSVSAAEGALIQRCAPSPLEYSH